MKIGGGLLSIPHALARTAAAVAAAALRRPLVVVPGGGPFADTVRRFDREHGLSPVAAHWMAILGQDQYAHVLAERIPGASLVAGIDEIGDAIAGGRIPVLAPYRWMRDADVLPHSWDATGDSVAAFAAGALDSDLLVLVKPAADAVPGLVDRCFRDTLPAGVAVVILGAADVERLPSVLENGAAS